MSIPFELMGKSFQDALSAAERTHLEADEIARSLMCGHSGGMGKYHLNTFRLSWHIRRRFSQREITTIYANRAYFGVGIVGIERASQEFFQKEPKDLSADEAALIAGLLRAPGYLSPYKNPERALQRRNDVLNEMVAQGKLSEKDAARLTAIPIVTRNSGPMEISPESVVRELYQQVVARKPLGIPKGEDKAAVAPFLSKRLLQTLDVGQSCEDDYRRKHPDPNSKPAFHWLEFDLFSGGNENAIPAEAKVEKVQSQKTGSFRVYVRLTYKESFETYGRPPDPENTLSWSVVAVVISEGERFVVDDVLFLKDTSTKIESRLPGIFTGCDGPRWVGYNK